MDGSLSARLIMRSEPVQGLDVIALTDETEMLSAAGDKVTLQEIRPGMRVQASGRTGSRSSLLAKQARILP